MDLDTSRHARDEHELQAMRNVIYGQQSKEGWDNCKEHWFRDAEWLEREFFKLTDAQIMLDVLRAQRQQHEKV